MQLEYVWLYFKIVLYLIGKNYEHFGIFPLLIFFIILLYLFPLVIIIIWNERKLKWKLFEMRKELTQQFMQQYM